MVFGSYSKGEDTSKSDIDIAVVTKKQAKLDLNRFEKHLRKKISIYEIQISGSSKEFLNNLANGTVVYGFLRILQ